MSKLIIFDLDDTLIHTHDVYLRLSQDFIDLLAEHGIEDENLYYTLDSFDQENVEADGCFLQSAFPRAMLQTYEFYCQKLDCEYNEEVAAEISEIGWEINTADYKLADGALALLDELSDAGHTLVLLTQGESEVQRRKVTDKNLQIYFRELYVSPKKCDEDITAIMQRYEADACDTWIIGNSLRSDIAPAVRLGTKCIHVQQAPGWAYEQDESVKADCPVVNNLMDCLEIIAADCD